MPAGRRRQTEATATAQTATVEETKARLSGCGLRSVGTATARRRHGDGTATARRRRGDGTATAHGARHGDGNGDGDGNGSRRTATTPDLSLTLSAFASATKQRKSNEETAKRPKGTDPILHFAPKPLKGLVNGNGNENGTNGARSTEHDDARHGARTQRTQAGSGKQAGSPTDYSPTAAQVSGKGSPTAAQWTAVAQRQAADSRQRQRNGKTARGTGNRDAALSQHFRLVLALREHGAGRKVGRATAHTALKRLSRSTGRALTEHGECIHGSWGLFSWLMGSAFTA
jgi:hypothetical protein